MYGQEVRPDEDKSMIKTLLRVRLVITRPISN